ncbi:unnamed protein product [Ectocarpus sp. 4 AP-2014]
MMQESDVNSRDASNRTPLHWAAGNGQLGVLRELMFWGARVECTDAWRKVPLHWAAFRGHVASVEELVGKGSPVDQPDADGNIPGSTFHHSVPEEAIRDIRSAMQRGPASGDGVVRAATVSSELLLETLRACRSWGELFENRHFDVLSKECQEHRERLRDVIQGLADQGKAEGLEPCLKAMDLLNSALGLHEDMRSGTKPVPLGGGGAGQATGASSSAGGGGRGGGGGGGGRDRRGTGDSGGPPRAGGEHRSSEELRDFLSTDGNGGGGEGRGGGGAPPPPGGQQQDGSSSAASLRLYQLPAVREACGGFDQKRCIGEGGFGKVYRGSMMGLPVAVKKLDETGLQGREQFFREVEVLSTCRHENIVPLLGVCMEPPCLVYRLMPNNSLRHHLDDPALRSRLGWRLRVRTTIHMCSGLEYLHSDSTNKPKVIHGDIKPENILLDEYLKARLSDFGISRVGESEAKVSRPRPPAGGGGRGGRRGGLAQDDDAALQGTFGYMDPVYQSTGRLDERSDVFSLGVVMLELLTGDPVHCPDKTPPGLVDRVRKALDERSLKGVVDRSAVWSKTAAKAYARLACGCCAEAPGTRPTLREVSEKVKAIQETGQRSTSGGGEQHAAAAGLFSSDAMSRSPATTAAATNQPSAPSATGATTQQGEGDDLLGLFDHVQRSSKPVDAAAGSGATKSPPQQHQQRTPTRRPPPPPPPYDTAIQNSSPKTATTVPPPAAAAAKQPPPYREALAARHGGSLLAIDGDDGVVEEKAAGGGELVDLGQDFGRQISASSGESGGSAGNNPEGGAAAGTREWWAASSSSAKPYSGAPAPAPSGRNPATTMGPSLGSIGGGGGGRGGGGSTGSALSDLGKGGGSATGGGDSSSSSSSKNDSSISCTLSTSLAEYAAGLPGVLRAAKSGGVLSSNPRLLCVCNNNSNNNGIVSSSADAGGAEGGAPAAGQQDSAGHVSVLDLWHRGRTVRYPVAADRAAMSPNQSESVIAVLGGGSLHVFSIPRRCRLQEQAVATDLCMWRWLSPWGLALVTDGAVFYWSVLDGSIGGNSPERGGSTGGGGLDRDVSGAGDAAANERESTARSRRPRQAFARRRTLTRPDTLHRVYDYQASADGRWGLLLCAVVDRDWGGGGGGGSGALGNGYGSHSSGIEGGGGPVKVDLHSFERGTTFEFEVLGASLMTMPGSSPPLNLLGLVVRGEGGATELRVLDLDRSLAQAESAEDLERLAELGEGWLIATTHVIADVDLRGSCSYRVVGVDGRERGGLGEDAATGEAPPLVCPPVFLRQWTENTNVVFVVGCHGLLLVLDVVTGAELARAQACRAPLIEAEVDPDVGDLVVVSTADGGGVHRLGVRAAALRESVEYYHKDPEMATRVSALTGYAGVRPLPPPRRQA